MTRFVITVRGEAGPTVRSALENVDVSVEENVTLLRAELVDRAAFNGLLQQLQDLGIEIIEVRRDGD
jgi:hypothetical protein